MGREEDRRLTLQRLQALERENAELQHENSELRGTGPRRDGGRMTGNWTKRVRVAFASSGVLVTVVVLLALTAGVAGPSHAFARTIFALQAKDGTAESAFWLLFRQSLSAAR